LRQPAALSSVSAKAMERMSLEVTMVTLSG
jgi:hypothetical protein